MKTQTLLPKQIKLDLLKEKKSSPENERETSEMSASIRERERGRERGKRQRDKKRVKDIERNI